MIFSSFTSRKLEVLRPEIIGLLLFGKLTLCILAFILPGLSLYSILIRVFPTFQNQPPSTMIAIFFGCAAISAAVLSTNLFRNTKNKINRFELWIFGLCSKFNGHKSTWHCWMVPAFYQHPIIEHKEQTHAVNSIIALLESGEGPGYAVISGHSGSGKTLSIARIINQIIVAEKVKTPRMFLYYDFQNIQDQDDFIRETGSVLRSNSIVFIDNTHMATPEIVIQLTTYISKKTYYEIFFVILCQPMESWRVNPDLRIELLNMAESNHRFFSLSGIKNKSVERFLEATGFKINPAIQMMSDLSYTASVSQVALAGSLCMYQEKQNDPRLDLINFLSNPSNNGDKKSKDFLLKISVVVSIAIHRGSFQVLDFVKIISEINKNSSAIRRLYILFSSIRWIHLMEKTGIFQKSKTSPTQYILHEKIAEEWKDYFFSFDSDSSKYFKEVFFKSVELQLSTRHLSKDICWLLAIESGKIDLAEQSFYPALYLSNFNRMLNCLDRNKKAKIANEMMTFQYSVLLDRVGRFTEARNTIESVEKEKDPDDPCFIRLALLKIESEHGDDSLQLISSLDKSETDSIRFAANYWRVHINAHKGIFSYETLKSLLLNIQSWSGNSTTLPDYQTAYIYSRVLFDGCRHAYLQGQNVTSKIQLLFAQPIVSTIQKLDPQFSAYKSLYTRSHWLGHECLYRCAFLGERMEEMVYPFSISPVEVTEMSIEELAFFVRDQYKFVQSEFKAIGGREALYLSADILNADLICGDISDNEIERRLREYDKFIKNSGFTEIYSFPHFYKLKWHIIQFCNETIKGFADRAKIHLDLACEQCSMFVELDKSAENKYGLWRGSLFRALLLAEYSQKKYKKNLNNELARLKKEAEDLGYYRDSNIVGRLLECDLMPNIFNLKNFFTYYPFVHQ